MISGQIDRLRTAAQTYRRLGNHSAESMLLDAADTIWKLRDDLQRVNADNAKLRELVRELWRTMDLLNACDVSEYDEPLNCIYCEQWGTVGKNIVGCKLKYRMCELGVDA